MENIWCSVFTIIDIFRFSAQITDQNKLLLKGQRTDITLRALKSHTRQIRKLEPSKIVYDCSALFAYKN